MRHGKRVTAIQVNKGGLIATIALALALPTPVLAQNVDANQAQDEAPTEQTYQFDISSKPLPQAIVELSAITELQVLYTEQSAFNHTAPALEGRYTIQEALQHLISGGGLVVRFTGKKSVTIERPSQGSVTWLPLITVTAESDGVTTENSGMYGSSVGTTSLPFNTSLRDTPQSVSIISNQFIEDKKISDIGEVVDNTTGLSINRYESNRGSLFARGFNINILLIDGAQTSINEQWSAGEILGNTAIYDRVEVLRGSNGLMTGVGNPSAMINLVRKKADSKVLRGSISVEGGSWAQKGVTLDISTPLSESGATRGRFVAAYDESDSYVDLLENEGKTFYGTIEQDIGDHSLVSAGVSYQENHTNSPTWGGLPAWFATSPTAAWRTDWSRSKSTSADWSYWNTDYLNAFVKAEHEFDNGWRVKASYTRGERNSESALVLLYPYPIYPAAGTSYLHYDLGGGFIYSYPVSGYAGKYYVSNVKQDVNVQIEGDFNLLSRTHEFAFGYDHSKERLKTDGQPGILSSAVFTTPNIFSLNGDIPVPTFVAKQNYLNNDITQKAFYGAGRLSLFDPLKLIVGVRVVDYQVVDLKDHDNDFQFENQIIPYAGLVFDLTENISTYASYTNIFEPQERYDADNKLLSPINGNTYEVGLKGQFFDNRLNASLAVFTMKQSNVAEYVGYNSVLGQGIYRETDGTTSEGFEMEVVGEVLPNWNITVGYSQFTAKTADDEDVNPLIPRKQFNLFTSYQLPANWDALTVGGGVRWQSKTYAYQAATGLPAIEQEAYYLVDLMARYQMNDQWSAQLNINNLLDEKYYAPTEDAMQIYWQEPRNAELSLKYQF